MSDGSYKGLRATVLAAGASKLQHAGMTSSSLPGGPVEHEPSWASETLPLSVRKELLERELSKLGYRKEGTLPLVSVQQQQQQLQQPPAPLQADAGAQGEPGRNAPAPA